MSDRTAVLFGTSRDRPLHFAGRQYELETLTKRLQYIRATGDVSGGMILVEGVQGVGKKQLLDEFGRRAVASATPAGSIAWLSISTASIRDEFTLFSRIVAAVGHREREAERIAGLASRATGGAIAGVRINVERAVRQTNSLEQLLVRSKREGLWETRAMILSVDEIQNVTAEERRVLRQLHEGRHGCPLMVVGAGLQHATERLGGRLTRADGTTDSAVISRFAKRLSIGPLSRAETMEAIIEGLASLGHRIDQAAAAALAVASMDFPQHVHGYVEGALESISKHGDLASQVALESALAHGDGARVSYYQERLKGMERPELMMILADAMRRTGREYLPWSEAANLLGDVTEGERALEDAIAHGVLTKGTLRQLSFGLPSFRSYIDRTLRTACLTADVDEIACC